jgi:hypothetical protein
MPDATLKSDANRITLTAVYHVVAETHRLESAVERLALVIREHVGTGTRADATAWAQALEALITSHACLAGARQRLESLSVIERQSTDWGI